MSSKLPTFPHFEPEPGCTGVFRLFPEEGDSFLVYQGRRKDGSITPDWYASRDGKAYHRTRTGFTLPKFNYTPNRPAGKNGGTAHYYYIRSLHSMSAHIFICSTFHPLKVDDPENYDCHHKNGIQTDNNADNLVWLRRGTEHPKYDARLKQLKKSLGTAISLYSYEDFDRWYAMSDADFQAMLASFHHDHLDFNARMERDMSHHVER